MGDVSRHRDIFLSSRNAVPTTLLGQAKVSRDDLTYVELGNYLTDVSQFRDPVTYIFTKRRIWREKVIPKVADKFPIPKAAIAAIGAGVVAGTKLAEDVLPDELEKLLYGVGGSAALAGLRTARAPAARHPHGAMPGTVTPPHATTLDAPMRSADDHAGLPA